MNNTISCEDKSYKLKNMKISCEDNVLECIKKIDELNNKYNIFLEVKKNEALNRAKELDKKAKSSSKLGKLFGLVIGIKSNISHKGYTMSCASKTLENYKATFNADIIEKILKEDAIIIGVVNNDEFACGSSGETSYYGKTINPFTTSRIPGGSSSGSAAAVSSGMCDIAFASDTGGSIRNPASHCSVCGVKPSYGRVSRYGLIDLSMSLDQIGPIANDAYGCAIAMEVISGNSENDPTTTDNKIDEYTIEIGMKKKFKIGYIKTFDKLITDKRIKEMMDATSEDLKKKGHEIIEIDIENIDLAIQAYYPIVYTEFFSGTRKFDSIKYGHVIENTTGEEALRRILGGKEISKSEFDGAYYKKALKVKEIISNEFERVFKEVDLILCPVTPMLPHKFGTKLSPEEMYAYDAFTIPANLGGICAGVVSSKTIKDDGEDVSAGIQLFADKFKESILFAGMREIEKLK